jgi:hypothetical protein
MPNGHEVNTTADGVAAGITAFSDMLLYHPIYRNRGSDYIIKPYV